MSRRKFTRTVGGAAVAGATIASGILAAQAPKENTFTPVPVPGGTPVLGGVFHVFGPGIVDPVDPNRRASQISTDLSASRSSQEWLRAPTSTGESLRLPFVNNDMRFMIGTFRGSDGRVHQGAFAFI
jgi:hypothetical protein